jgi:hypothetical protein
MHNRHWSWSAVLVGSVIGLAAVFAASGADAQNAKKATTGGSAALITGSSFDGIVAALENNGFSVDMTTDGDGDPMIESTDNDEPFNVHFYGCTDGKDCEYIEFTEGWDLPNGTTPDVIEKWNEDRVWGRAYLDSENDPWVDMAVNLKGGVSAENFDDTVSWWWSVIRDFEDDIGFNK